MPQPIVTPTRIAYDRLTSAQLRARLRRRRIQFSGLRTKQQLINRLIASDGEQISPSRTNCRPEVPPRAKTSIVDRLLDIILSRALLSAIFLLIAVLSLMQQYYTMVNKVTHPQCHSTSINNMIEKVGNGRSLICLSYACDGGLSVVCTLVTWYRFPSKSFTWIDYPQLYATLGLKWGASQEEVRARHRELNKIWHPDRFRQHEVDVNTANQITRVINHAAQILGNNRMAAEYARGRLVVNDCQCAQCFGCG